MNKKRKRIAITREWMIVKRLTNTETSKLLILARAAGMRTQSDDFYMSDSKFPYLICTGNNNLDLSSVRSEYISKYTYNEIMEALIRKIKRNKYKYK